MSSLRILLCGERVDALIDLARSLQRVSSLDSIEVFGAARSEDGEFSCSVEEVEGIRVWSARRADLHPAFWQKSLSVDVRAAFRDRLKEGEYSLVHVLGWRGLTRDLVQTAAGCEVPSVLSLASDESSCLLPKRIRPDSGEACEASFGAGTCLACVRDVEPTTPWVSFEEGFLAFGERSLDLEREIRAATRVIAPSSEQLERLRGFGAPLGNREILLLDPSDVEALARLYADAVTSFEPSGTGGATDDWYEERMTRFKETEWDKRCREEHG